MEGFCLLTVFYTVCLMTLFTGLNNGYVWCFNTPLISDAMYNVLLVLSTLASAIGSMFTLSWRRPK